MGRQRKGEPVLTKTDRHGTRDKLVGAAETLFADRGMHGTQVADITKAAGVSVGTFYRYFRDKDDLYEALVVARFGEHIASIEEIVGDLRGLSVFERVDVIRQVFSRTFAIHVSNPDAFALWFRHGFGASPAVAARVHELTLELEALLVRVLDRTITVGGTLDEATRTIIARSMIGIANTMSQRMITEGAPSPDEAVEVCTQLVIGGLLGFAPRERYELLMELYRQETENRAARSAEE